MRIGNKLFLLIAGWIILCSIPPMFCISIDFRSFACVDAPNHQDCESIHQLFKSKLAMSLAVCAISLALSLVGTFAVIYKTLKPAGAIVTFAYELAKGSFPSEIKGLPPQDEFGLLARFLNLTKDRIQYSMVRLRTSCEREKQARVEAESINKTKSDFIKDVSNQLTTPLAPILATASMILDSKKLAVTDPDIQKKIRSIRDCAENMMAIVTGMGELARFEDGSVEPNIQNFELAEFLKDISDLHHLNSEAKRIAFKTIYSSNLPAIIHSDRGILFQILTNLLSYSIHYSPPGSEVLFGCDTTTHNIVFWIRDGVAGTHGQIVSKLMKTHSSPYSEVRMFLGNSRLMGVVAALCNAEILKADLQIDFKEGVGSEFKLFLRKTALLDSKEEDTPPKFHTATNIPGRSAQISNADSDAQSNILVAMPEGADLEMARQLLADMGVEHSVVHLMSDCIQKLQEKKFDTLILDMALVDLDAPSSLADIKTLCASLPVIAVTSHVDTSERDKLVRIGVAECLAKPLQFKDILHAVSVYA